MSTSGDFNQGIIEEFRANHGLVGGGFNGATLVILHTTGAKTGQARVNPLVSLTGTDGKLYIFASAAGAPSHPDWYRNLVAHPSVEVELGDETFKATATPVTGKERDRVFAEQVAAMPGFADYEAKTTRVIPVIELTRS